MRFTERELTLALEGAAKSVLAVRDKDVRKKRRTPDEAWAALSRYQRFQLLDGLGDQLLGVLVALPDVEVAVGTRPTFTDKDVETAVRERSERPRRPPGQGDPQGAGGPGAAGPVTHPAPGRPRRV